MKTKKKNPNKNEELKRLRMELDCVTKELNQNAMQREILEEKIAYLRKGIEEHAFLAGKLEKLRCDKQDLENRRNELRVRLNQISKRAI